MYRRNSCLCDYEGAAAKEWLLRDRLGVSLEEQFLHKLLFHHWRNCCLLDHFGVLLEEWSLCELSFHHWRNCCALNHFGVARKEQFHLRLFWCDARGRPAFLGHFCVCPWRNCCLLDHFSVSLKEMAFFMIWVWLWRNSCFLDHFSEFFLDHLGVAVSSCLDIWLKLWRNGWRFYH